MNEIGILLVFSVAAFLFYKGYTIKKNQRERFKKPEGVKEWHDIKYGNGFIVLHWSELERWNLASVREKCELINHQQTLIKQGLVKIVKENGERRLVTNQNFKQVNEQRKPKN